MDAVRARLVTIADAPEVVRLAGLMYATMGQDPETPGWRHTAEASVVQRLGKDLIVVGVDDPERPNRLVAAGAATVATRLPSPRNPSAQVGYVQWVATEPAWRRRGLARKVMVALLEATDARGVGVVELHATVPAEGVYRRLGFGGDGPAALRRFRPGSAQPDQ